MLYMSHKQMCVFSRASVTGDVRVAVDEGEVSGGSRQEATVSVSGVLAARLAVATGAVNLLE